ncbi:MAG TPA: hypothetical protein VIH42_10235 [Thermoguttaceae bacterium]
MATAKGPITDSVEQLRRLLAQSAAFQERIGVEDAETANTKIFMYEYEDDPVTLKEMRPFAAIWPAGEFDLSQHAGGSKNWLMGRGDLILLITDIDRAEGDRVASAENFISWLDEVLMDIAELNGQDDYLPIRKVSFHQPPARNTTKDEPSAGAYWHVSFLVSW